MKINMRTVLVFGPDSHLLIYCRLHLNLRTKKPQTFVDEWSSIKLISRCLWTINPHVATGEIKVRNTDLSMEKAPVLVPWAPVLNRNYTEGPQSSNIKSEDLLTLLAELEILTLTPFVGGCRNKRTLLSVLSPVWETGTLSLFLFLFFKIPFFHRAKHWSHGVLMLV